MTPQVGTVLAGKYRIEHVIGEGGMGVVVAAMHLQLDQRVAIKFLLPQAMERPEIVERFAREAKAAARVRGQHVARVIDVGELESGQPYMVMEYLEGEDLDRALRRGPLPVKVAVRYLVEACDALAEAHAAGIVHRDLKPGNLFIATQPGGHGIVKVLDFGISKIVEPGSEALTRTASMMGTAYYMSPEQLTSSKHVDARSDIWALGVILYELLAGHRPFEGDTMPEVVGKILQNLPEALRSIRPDAPAGVEAAILRCLQTRIESRYTNVAELANALAPFSDVDVRPLVERAQRVLGIGSMPPPASAMPWGPDNNSTAILGGGATPPEPYANTMPVAVQSVEAQLAARAAQGGGLTAPSPNVLERTTGALVSSAATEPTKKKSVVPIVVALVGSLAFVGAIGGTALVLRKPASPPLGETKPPASTQVMATASTDPRSTPSVATLSPPTTAAPAESTAVATPSATASGKSHTVKPGTVSSAGHATATTAGQPPTPPPSSGKNPLNMGLK